MFESTKLKIQRAEHHIADLEGQIKEFIALKPHTFRIKHDEKTGQPSIQIKFERPIPETFPMIIGDAIHNLRCALDHMIWALIAWEGGTQHRNLHFPSGDNRVNYEALTKGMLKECKVRPWITPFFIDLEVFPGGLGDWLYQLNMFDIADKHNVITPALRATGHPALTIYNSDGTRRLRMERNTFITPRLKNVLKITSVPPGGWVELDGNTDCPPSIFIAEAMHGEALIVLNVFRVCVYNALLEMETAVAQNPKN